MDDYFQLAGYNEAAKGVLAKAKLDGSTKTWWKSSCRARGVIESTQSWGDVKGQLRERYLSLNYITMKMDEFLACTRRECPVDDYYEEFLKLSRHALDLTKERTLSRFIQGLEASLADKVEALRPSSLVDAFIRSKYKLKSVQKRTADGDKQKVLPYKPPPPFKNPKTFQSQVANFVGFPVALQ